MRRQIAKPDAGPLRVLVVEDDPADLRLIAQALGAAHDPDLRLLRANSLTDAMETLSVSAVSLVVLDLNLPESSGLDTLAAVRRHFPVVPLVVLTGDDDHELGRQCISAGAQDFLTKSELVGPLLWRSIEFSLSRVQRLEARADERLRTVIASLASATPTADRTQSTPVPAAANSVRRVSLAPTLGQSIAVSRSNYLNSLHQIDLGAARTQLQDLAERIADADPHTTDVLRELLHSPESRGNGPSTVDVTLYAIELLGALSEVYRQRAKERTTAGPPDRDREETRDERGQ